jgi:hypothetical protein
MPDLTCWSCQRAHTGAVWCPHCSAPVDVNSDEARLSPYWARDPRNTRSQAARDEQAARGDWERAFAWLRERAPSAGTIEVLDDPTRRDGCVVRLEGATEQELERVRVGLGIRAPWTAWEVQGERAPDRAR